jgi:transposase
LSTKIHATCDALGNPTRFHLTPGQKHDLEGADALLPGIEADYILADSRVIQVLSAQNQVPIIPPKSNRKNPRDYDRHLYKCRHLIENFFAKLKQYRAIATRYDKLSAVFLGAIYLVGTVIWTN